MKKVLVVLGVLAIALSASALTIKGQDFVIHLQDGSTLFYDDDGNPQTPKVPRAPGEGGDIGDENRSVAVIDQITYADGSQTNIQPGVLSALLYDLIVTSVFQIPPPPAQPLAIVTTAAGGRLQFWLDPTPEDPGHLVGPDYYDVMNPLVDGQAPTHWVENGRPEGDTFPNVNAPYPGEDAILWLETILLPIDAAGNTIYTTIFPGTSSGSSVSAYLKIVDLGFGEGAGAYQFARGVFTTPMGAAADLSLSWTLYAPGNDNYDTVTPYAKTGGWQIESSDPIQGKGKGIPEPMTIALLGLGLAGLAYRRLK